MINMTIDEMQKEKNEVKWEKEASKAFSALYLSRDITEFDRTIFGDQYDNFFNGLPVKLPDVDDINYKRIRSNRLKRFGYAWQAEIKTWIMTSSK